MHSLAYTRDAENVLGLGEAVQHDFRSGQHKAGFRKEAGFVLPL
jgi:hypothetical protein